MRGALAEGTWGSGSALVQPSKWHTARAFLGEPGLSLWGGRWLRKALYVTGIQGRGQREQVDLREPTYCHVHRLGAGAVSGETQTHRGHGLDCRKWTGIRTGW